MLILYLKKIVRQEKAVVYSMLGTVWRIVFAPVSLYLISIKLSPELQGYYYLFFSIAGLQQIFEVGFSHTLVQGISHEMGRVSFVEGKIIGDKEGIFKIEETLKLGFLWYSGLGVLCLLIICPVGILLMGGVNDDLSSYWLVPWIVFIVLFSINLFFYPINFFVEGIQHIERIYRIRLIIQIIGNLSFILFLYLDWKLFCAIAIPLFSIIINIVLLYIPYMHFFNQYIFRFPSKQFIRSILKWQLKIGFVYSSGYLYWQLPTVVIFHILGPVISGQYSMTVNIINSIMNIGQVFVRTKAAIIGELRNSNNILAAFRIYKRATIMSYITVFLGSVVFFIFWSVFPNFQLFNRMLSWQNTIALFIIFTATLRTLNQAMYCRCSKDEPFFYLSIFINFGFPLILLTCLFLKANIHSVILSFLLLHVIEIIWGEKIFTKFRKLELKNMKI